MIALKTLAMLLVSIVLWILGGLWWFGLHFNYAVPVTFVIGVLCLYVMATRWQIFDRASTRWFASVAYMGALFWPVAAATMYLMGPPVMLDGIDYTWAYAGAMGAFGIVLLIIGAWALSMILAIRVWKVQE